MLPFDISDNSFGCGIHFTVEPRHMRPDWLCELACVSNRALAFPCRRDNSSFVARNGIVISIVYSGPPLAEI